MVALLFTIFSARRYLYFRDGSTSGGGFVRVLVSHPKVNWGWHRDMLQEQQHKLIEKYDIVLCTDVDEIVAPDPRTRTLGDYINRFEHGFVNCRLRNFAY